MKIFFDTEFTGLHKDTTLISIGLVSEDNRMFYAELTDFDASQCDDWIRENVIDNLVGTKPDSLYVPNLHVGTKDNIAKSLRNWLLQFNNVELVSDVCHYDMVLFCDIFGGAFDIPNNVSACCYDINQDIAEKYQISQKDAFDKSREEILWDGYKEQSIAGDKHNALYDAKVIRQLYQILNNVKYD